MGYQLKQSQTAKPLVFLMVSSTDHITPVTGITPTVTLSKNGAAFGAPSGAVSEIGSGWYKVAGNATDTNTLGPLLLHATGTGADVADEPFEVVAFDPDDAAGLGLSRIDAAVTTRLAPTTAGRTLDVTSTGAAGIDWGNVENEGATVTLSGTSIASADEVGQLLGLVNLTADHSTAITASTAQGGAAGSITLSSGATSTTDFFKGAIVHIVAGTGLGQARIVTAYNGTSKVATVNRDWATAPDNTSEYVIRVAEQAALDTSLRVTAASVAGNVGGNLTGSVGSLASQAQTDVQSALTAQGYTGTRAGYLDTLNGLVANIWAYLSASATTANSIGKRIVDYLDAAVSTRATQTSVDAIKAKTDQLAFTTANQVDATAVTVSDKTGYALTSGERTAIAEAIFKLDLSTITGESRRSLLNAIRKQGNKWSISGTTLTVYKEDDSTSAYTETLSVSSGAITGSDPT